MNRRLIIYMADRMEDNLRIRSVIRGLKMSIRRPARAKMKSIVKKIYGATTSVNMRRARAFIYFDKKYEGIANDFKANGAEVYYVGTEIVDSGQLTVDSEVKAEAETVEAETVEEPVVAEETVVVEEPVVETKAKTTKKSTKAKTTKAKEVVE